MVNKRAHPKEAPGMRRRRLDQEAQNRDVAPPQEAPCVAAPCFLYKPRRERVQPRPSVEDIGSLYYAEL